MKSFVWVWWRLAWARSTSGNAGMVITNYKGTWRHVAGALFFLTKPAVKE